MKNKIINLILVIIVFIMLAINIIIYINNNYKTENNTSNENISQENNISVNNEVMENTINSRIEKMTDRNRMQTYFGTFITYVEKKDYEKAYSLLNEDFKNNYFKTIENFKEYLEKYPKDIMVNYTDIDRQGELYVLTVEISDMFDEETPPMTQRVVIKENDLNSFTISFQVE